MQRNVVLALALLCLLAAGYAFYAFRSGVAVPGVGEKLAEELAPETAIISKTITVAPGKIYALTPSPSGYDIVEKQGYSLVEKLVLANVTIQPNDAITPHLYDWWFDGVDDYVVYPYVGSSDVLSVYVLVAAKPTIVNNGYSQHVVKLRGSITCICIGRATSSYGFHAYNASGSGGALYYFPCSDAEWHWLGMAIDAPSGIAKVFTDGNSIDASQNLGIDNLADYERIYISLPPYIVKGKVASALMYEDYVEIPSQTYTVSKPSVLLDPTFFNGTHYVDLVSGVAGTPYNGVLRVPAECMWLWLVKDLTSDNKLHFKWFPAGSIIRIHVNNTVYEYVVQGEGQVPDFAVNLSAAVIPEATIEAIVPTTKCRFYIPEGFKVKVTSSDGTVWAEATSTGYVDLPVPEGQVTVEVVAKDVQEGNMVIEANENSYGGLDILVRDKGGFPITHALVLLKDPLQDGKVVYYGETDAAGKLEVPKDAVQGAAQLIVEVHYLKSGVYYHDTEQVQLIKQVESTTQPQETQSLTIDRLKFIMMGIVAVAIIASVAVMARRR